MMTLNRLFYLSNLFRIETFLDLDVRRYSKVTPRVNSSVEILRKSKGKFVMRFKIASVWCNTVMDSSMLIFQVISEFLQDRISKKSRRVREGRMLRDRDVRLSGEHDFQQHCRDE